MYACVTDYAAIYNESYRKRRGNHTSFDRSVLPALIAAYCKQIGVERLLDISGGQGELGRSLSEHGIATITTDVGALPGSNVIPFDLSQQSHKAVEEIIQEIHPDIGDYITTCLDVLEHIDREHVSNAILNLTKLTQRYLIVSISTRPSAYDNLLHSSILPIQTWIRAFGAAGFKLVELDAFADAISRRIFPINDELRLINRWTTADIFHDGAFGEPRYLVLYKFGPIYNDEASSEINFLLDVSYRFMKRERFVLGNRIFNLSLHHHQEWSLLRPLLDVLPRSQVRFLIRPNEVAPDSLRAIRSFLARCGVIVIEYTDVRQLPWADLRGEIFISGAESSVGAGHLMGYEAAAVARLHGCSTFLLQHGIWPRAFNERIVTFASEHVISWGREDENRLNEQSHKVMCADVPWGVFPSEQAFAMGSPKFCDQLLAPIPGLDAKFGHDVSQFEQCVMIGAKNLCGRWGVQNINADFLSILSDIIANCANTLFIIRPHPSDSAEELSCLPRENTVFFDDVASILCDMPMSRVMPKVDLLLTSPSSLIVDAAVSRVPILMYDTGQPIEYDEIDAVPLNTVICKLKRNDCRGAEMEVSDRIRNRYAESTDSTFYEKFSSLIVKSFETKIGEYKVDKSIATSVTLAIQAVQHAETSRVLSAEVELLKDCRNKLNVGIEDKQDQLLNTISKLESSINTMHEEIKNITYSNTLLEQDNLIMRNSPFWRMSQQLRNFIVAFRRLIVH